MMKKPCVPNALMLLGEAPGLPMENLKICESRVRVLTDLLIDNFKEVPKEAAPIIFMLATRMYSSFVAS